MRFLFFGIRWVCIMFGIFFDRGGVVVYDGVNFWGFKWRYGSRWGVGIFGIVCFVDLGGRFFVIFFIFMFIDKRVLWEMLCDGKINM